MMTLLTVVEVTTYGLVEVQACSQYGGRTILVDGIRVCPPRVLPLVHEIWAIYLYTVVTQRVKDESFV